MHIDIRMILLWFYYSCPTVDFQNNSELEQNYGIQGHCNKIREFVLK